MSKVFFLTSIVIFLFNACAYSQGAYTSANSRTGNWEVSTMWTKQYAWMTNPPPPVDVNGSYVVNIYGYVTRNGSLTVSGGGSIHVYDTLVIDGALNISSSSGIVVHDGGLLIVLGDFTATSAGGNKIENQGTGRVVITGNYTQNGGTVTTGNNFYVYDNSPTYNWGAAVNGTTWNGSNTATLGSNNDSSQSLFNNDRPLSDFLTSLGAAPQCAMTPSYRTKGNAGTWTTTTDWATARPPYTLTAGAYTIPANQIVTIESSNFNLNNADLIVYGTLIVNGRINLTTGKKIDIKSGGSLICCNNCNNSNKVVIGNETVWTGTVGPVYGPSIISEDGILPVELLFFTAQNTDASITLQWATATELNFNMFIIERSNNGKDFTAIGEQEGAINSQLRRDYSFVDNNPVQGRNYYRLNSVDLDNTDEYSGIVTAEYTGARKVTVYPNPTDNNSIGVLINFAPAEGARVQIYNLLGIKLQESTITNFKSQIMFDNNFKSGAYLLRYTSTSHTEVVRFVVK